MNASLSQQRAARYRRRLIDKRAHLSNVLIQWRDAIEDDIQRLVGEAGLQCESVARKDVASIVSAPVKEIVVVQIEEFSQQFGPNFRLVDVDVCVLVVRVDAETNCVFVLYPHNDLETSSVCKATAFDPDEVERLFLALSKRDFDSLLRAGRGEQLAQLFACCHSRGFLVLRRLRGRHDGTEKNRNCRGEQLKSHGGDPPILSVAHRKYF